MVIETQVLLEQLTAEHRRLDEQVQSLEKRRALTPAAQAEIAHLKKRKLWTKDQIARLASPTPRATPRPPA